MLKFKDFTNRVVEVYYKNGSASEIGRLLGLNQRFIYLENRYFYVEETDVYACLGDAWLSLDTIKQISILENDDDIVVKFFQEKGSE